MTERKRLATVEGHHHDPQTEEELPIEPFPAFVFDAAYCGEPVPEGFDAVRISLDGKVKADLSWNKEREAAISYISQGKRIFWDLDLGLLNDLKHPLSNKTQYLSLSLSLEHFLNSLWKEFHQHTVGLCIYRGPIDFSKSFVWDNEESLNLRGWVKARFSDLKDFEKETNLFLGEFADLTPEMMHQSKQGSALLSLFCNEVLGQYLELLGSAMPDRLPLFLLLDAAGVTDPFFVSVLSVSEHFSRFHVGVKGAKPVKNFSWEGPFGVSGTIGRKMIAEYGNNGNKASCGLCLPGGLIYGHSKASMIKQAFCQLMEKAILFRVIAESELMSEWDGLDYLVIDSRFVDETCKRKLQGFCAAGGTVVELWKGMGFSQEISFAEWSKIMGSDSA